MLNREAQITFPYDIINLHEVEPWYRFIFSISDTYISFYPKIIYSSGSSEQIKCLISLSEILDHVSFEAAFSPISKLMLVGLSQSDFPSYNLDTFHLLLVLF